MEELSGGDVSFSKKSGSGIKDEWDGTKKGRRTSWIGNAPQWQRMRLFSQMKEAVK